MPPKKALAKKKNNAEPKLSFSHMRIYFFFGMIIFLTIITLILFQPFFYPIFWAAVIAVMFYPLYKKINKHIKHSGLSSFLMLLIVLAVLILPVTILALLIVNQSIELYSIIAARDLTADFAILTQWINQPILEPYVAQINSNWPTYITSATATITNYLISAAKSITSGSASFIFMFFIMMYSLFYFFKDGKHMLKRLMFLTPLGDKYEKMLFKRFTSVSRATLKGTIIVGAIQGFAGALLFWATGIEGVIIWGVIMAILSVVPALGSFIVWGPAGVAMLAMGNTWQGVTILLVGTIVISNIDNFLRPPLIGKDVAMHPILVLFSTLGGLILFGISGFIIGPIIIAMYLAIMSIYQHYYQNQLEHN
jgi:predicted PurR-regulated permease PerM